jgi:hypothetical protein
LLEIEVRQRLSKGSHRAKKTCNTHDGDHLAEYERAILDVSQ